MRLRSVPSLTLVLLLAGTSARGQTDFADPAMRAEGVAEAMAALTAGRFEDAVAPVQQLVAAENRHGLLLHALMQLTGAGVPLDQVAGMNQLRAAADAGNATAARELLASNPTGTPRIYRWRNAALRTDQRTPNLPATLAYEFDERLHLRFRAAAAWNQQHAATGDPVALFNVARYAELAPNLVGTTRERLASHLFDALRAGSELALGDLQYRLGSRTEETPAQFAAEIRRLTEASAEAGDPASQFLLGQALLQSAEDETDREAGRLWLNRAADQDYAPAARLLFELAESDADPASPSRDVERWLQLAAQSGHPLARARLLLSTPTEPDALAELDQLSREDERVLLLYADVLLAHPNLPCGGPADYVDRLQRAFLDGNAAAGYRAAKLLLQGRVDLRPNHARGQSQLQAAADQGSVEAQQELNTRKLRSVDVLLDKPLRQNFQPDPETLPPPTATRPAVAPESARAPIPSEAELQRRRDALEPRDDNAPPTPVFQSRPVYPEAMHRANIEGQALIRFTVDTAGVPRDLAIVNETAPVFGEEALATVARWRFAPGRKEGQAVDVQLQVPIIFNITDE